VPRKTILEIPEAEQAALLKELRAARYGYLLALHILLLCAEGHTPSEIASCLLCSRSSVYRAVAAYRSGTLRYGSTETAAAAADTPPKLRHWQRSLVALVKRSPSVYGWCRTRWSCQALALELKARRGYSASRETIRRTLHSLGYAWKRARHVARDDDAERVSKLARIRHVTEHLRRCELLLFVDELDIHLLPKIGYQWMLKATQTEIMTPGQNQKRYLAGALDYLTGKVTHVTAERKNRFLVIDLLRTLDHKFSAAGKIYLVADNYRIHKAKVVEGWLKNHPRFEILWLPRYCPRANPIERVFGDVHDKCTRNHQRTRIDELVSDVRWHFKRNGPWRYQLSSIYYTPEVNAAVAGLIAAENLKAA
jgi:putative transposase